MALPRFLQCPLCRNPLLLSPDGVRCPQNHSFDVSREGYINLLPVQKKHSREPGDSKEMIRCRRRFLDLGLYDRISDGVNNEVAACLAGRDGSILDAGCGEGFYLKRVKDFLEKRTSVPASFWYYGVDISKFAVRSAARRDRTMNWFVASVKDLPFAEGSFDMVLNIFSPPDFPEFARVLKGNGALAAVTPGPKHLNGLRHVIYPDAREHAPSAICEEAGKFFFPSSETRITYPIELKSREAVMDLLTMTPYYWNIDLATRARVEALDRLSLDVDVEVRVFRKRK